jgi:hypothetical protein
MLLHHPEGNQVSLRDGNVSIHLCVCEFIFIALHEFMVLLNFLKSGRITDKVVFFFFFGLHSDKKNPDGV